MNSPGFEQEIGIQTFYTNVPGVGGKLRSKAEDFRVTEIFSHPPKKEDGRFTIAEVSCTNWETHTLVRELAERLHISERQINFAGTKDRRAHTTQLMSFFNVKPQKVANVLIKDVEIKNVYTTDVPLRIGDLAGNRFDIIVRDIDATVTHEQIEALFSPLKHIGGFPNFYGIQRFGLLRPITHLVGQHILNGDFKNAVMTYIAHPIKGESEETYRLRKELETTHDFNHALQTYPNSLNFEKMMLEPLVQSPEDYVGALRRLPKNLLMMFISAYQSVLFNRIVSERIQQNIPLNTAILGDLVFPLRNNIIDTEQSILVTPTTIEKVNKQLEKKKAVISGLLIGSDPMYAEGEMGEIEHKIIEKEKITPRNFIIPEIPFLSSSGSRRAILASVDPLRWTLDPDTLNKEKQAVRLKFELPKGCYATCLVRELMKSDDPRDY